MNIRSFECPSEWSHKLYDGTIDKSTFFINSQCNNNNLAYIRQCNAVLQENFGLGCQFILEWQYDS